MGGAFMDWKKGGRLTLITSSSSSIKVTFPVIV